MARTRKIRVGVLFGGRSGEHEISLRSALTVMSAMDPRRYEIVPIGIGRDGHWSLQSDALRMLAEATPKRGALGRGGLPVSLLPYPDSRALVSMPSRNGHAENGHAAPRLPGPLDAVFPVLHGTFGEDGTCKACSILQVFLTLALACSVRPLGWTRMRKSGCWPAPASPSFVISL